MNAITIDRFDDYFMRLHGHTPYPWQRRLAERAERGDWPAAIDLPTGSGKTACLDVAVFALACQASRPAADRSAARRIFFCVNRRVIVDEAYDRARHIAERIWHAEENRDTGILADVATALRHVAGTTDRRDLPPLDALELRGGIYRDNRWARSLTQPAIVCTTLDQLGSRLLFRAYGPSPNAAPIHAALIAYDSVVLLDEAHISEPFRQTLAAVQRHLDPDRWAEQPIGVRPVTVVPMTATPPGDLPAQSRLELEDDDRATPALQDRLGAAKPAVLREPAKEVVKEAVAAALTLGDEEPAAIGIIVNRVTTARAIYTSLCERRGTKAKKGQRDIPADTDIHLVIGSMRPIDRDEQAQALHGLVGPGRPKPQSEATSFVVATQCLEVGADYDFDLLVTECASLDALRQRFGRLNRAGREIEARAAIIADQKAVKPEDKLDDGKPLDPIYGNALARTWNWLKEHATGTNGEGLPDAPVDFGIDAFTALLLRHGEESRPPKALLAPSASLDAPVLMPAYLDLWCQTAPRPALDPDVALFIHGPQAGEPDVQVCWRADLIEDELTQAKEHWCDVVALLPPTSAECMRVPISRMRRWLRDQALTGDETGDVIGEVRDDTDEGADRRVRCPAVLWRGARNTSLVERLGDLRPGDTVVIPAYAGGADLLGHLPERTKSPEGSEGEESDAAGGEAPPVRDVGELASLRARDRASLRLHRALHDRLGQPFIDLLIAAEGHHGEPVHLRRWCDLLERANSELPDKHDLKEVVEHLVQSGTTLRVDAYPDRRGVVLTTRRRIEHTSHWFLPATDEGDDSGSLVERRDAITLVDHSHHVEDAVATPTGALALSVDAETFATAAHLHDLGKADERFQAMLRRSNRTDAWLLVGTSSSLLAKSDALPQTQAQRQAARQRAGLPDGFRHEMLSVELAEHGAALPEDPTTRDVILHLVAAHHGHGRPFAPVVDDAECPTVEVDGIRLTHGQRAALVPSHRLDSGIGERFWRLTRRFGWWGLAYLEAVVRLADQQASADEDAGRYEQAPTRVTADTTP